MTRDLCWWEPHSSFHVNEGSPTVSWVSGLESAHVPPVDDHRCESFINLDSIHFNFSEMSCGFSPLTPNLLYTGGSEQRTFLLVLLWRVSSIVIVSGPVTHTFYEALPEWRELTGRRSQQLANDEIDVWQSLTGERQLICLPVCPGRWMTLQPCASGAIRSGGVSWEAHHHPSHSSLWHSSCCLGGICKLLLTFRDDETQSNVILHSNVDTDFTTCYCFPLGDA